MNQDLQGKTIGVTGANGFIGRAVMAGIAAGGGRPVALVRNGRAADACRETAADVRVVGEIDGTTNWLPHLAGCAVVIHLAARVHVMAETDRDPLAAFRRVNRDGTRKLAEDCVAATVGRLVFASSVKVNGEETGFDPASGQAVPFTERDEANPEDGYGLSKREAEEALFEIAAKTGLEVSIIRSPLVHGPGAGGNMRRLLRLIHKGIPLPFGAIDNRRSLIGVNNLADLLIVAGVHPRAAGRIFLAAEEPDISTPDLVRALAHALDQKPRLVSVPIPVLRLLGGLFGKTAEIDRLTKSLQVDAGAAARDLDWSPPVTRQAGFREMADHFLKSRK